MKRRLPAPEARDAERRGLTSSRDDVFESSQPNSLPARPFRLMRTRHVVIKRKLKLWEALALSLGLMGPTLAVSGNGQGIIATVGKAVPLVFLLGFIGVALVAYGFIRLTQRYNHAGSAYALVGATLGPRAGFTAGFALLGTYLFFTVCTAAVFGAFLNALLSSVFGASTSVGYGLAATACLLMTGYLNTRDTSTVSRALLAIEGLGIAAMLVLVVVILSKGGAESTGVDFTTFTPDRIGVGAVLAAVVAAFLSWAGFEACAALGEETDNPLRNIPRALFGCVLLTGVLFVVVMFAQTIGFGTDAAGLAAFQSSGNTLGDLSETYIAHWFALMVLVTAVLSAFASNLSAVMASARLAMALARDGFGPRQFAEIDPTHRIPRNAVLAAAAIGAVVNVATWLTGWPVMGTGDAAIDAYFYFAVVGATCLLFVYLLVEVAVFAAWRKGQISVRVPELALPALGGAFILVVIGYSVKDAAGLSPVFVAIAWVIVGVLVAIFAGKLADRIGVSLTKELAKAESSHSSADERHV
ncbi:APC family permease [Saccharopolyspora sp. NPDC002686]|uniref:APC family permease n=1 Tax=Saccharopolyspora sp. NPDC002686 TaxID=3154541 RepID=UPI00332516FD